MTEAQARDYLSAVPGWELTKADTWQLKRQLKCRDFLAAVEIVNEVAQLAEAEGHHPDLRIFKYRYLEITLFTHAIAGLSENDFIMAAKINEWLLAHPGLTQEE